MDVGTRVVVADRLMAVTRHLGTGGEGEVFELAAPDGDHRLALKWFHARTATPNRRAAIADLVARGAPSDAFLWPQGMVDDPRSGRFGYVMDLRPDGYVGLAALLRGRVPRHDRAVVRCAFELASAFRDLHLRGLCYRDINYGNAFMRPDTGSCLVCDVDNVGVEGVTEAQVLGAPTFTAPEIVRGEALPSKHTDRHSLAVLLFSLLVVHHPLEGSRTTSGLRDDATQHRHFGTDPLFCFDPDDAGNRPDPSLHAHVPGMWAALPTRVRDLFTSAFTVGLRHPRRRIVDSEWCAALAAMRSAMLTCPGCSRAVVLEDGRRPATCPVCGSGTEPVATLTVGGHTIVAEPGATVTRHHLAGDFDFTTVVGTVERHPTNHDLVGLRNDTPTPWTRRGPAGAVHVVAPGRRAGLADGTIIATDHGSWMVGIA